MSMCRAMMLARVRLVLYTEQTSSRCRSSRPSLIIGIIIISIINISIIIIIIITIIIIIILIFIIIIIIIITDQTSSRCTVCPLVLA